MPSPPPPYKILNPRLLWSRYIEPSNFYCYSRWDSKDILTTPPFCFSIAIGEGVQNVMAAIYLTRLLFPIPIEDGG